MHRGWIKLWRKVEGHWLYTEERRATRREAWEDLLLMAEHKPVSKRMNGQVHQVDRGQVLTTQIALANLWKWNRETVRKFLNKLDAENMTSTKTSTGTSTGTGTGSTLITIRNYGRYQDQQEHQTSTNASSNGGPPTSNLKEEEKKENKKRRPTPRSPRARAKTASMLVNIKGKEFGWPDPETLILLYNAEAADELPRYDPSDRDLINKAQVALRWMGAEFEFWERIMRETRKSLRLRGLKPSRQYPSFRGDLHWLLTSGKASGIENAVRVYEGKYRDGDRRSLRPEVSSGLKVGGIIDGDSGPPTSTADYVQDIDDRASAPSKKQGTVVDPVLAQGQARLLQLREELKRKRTG